MKYSRSKGGRRYAMMRVTAYAHEKLKRILLKIEQDMEERPEEYGSLAERRVTYSDLITLLCREYDRATTDRQRTGPKTA